MTRKTPRSAARRFFYALMFLLPLCVQAETYLHTGAWSKHIGGGDYNETHKLLAVEHEQIMAGYFENSHGDDSFLAAYRWRVARYQDVRVSVLAGGVYGYSHCTKGDDGGSKKLCPLIAPAVTYTAFSVQPSLSLMGNAVVFSIAWEL